jgi:hypothetical protein
VGTHAPGPAATERAAMMQAIGLIAITGGIIGLLWMAYEMYEKPRK